MRQLTSIKLRSVWLLLLPLWMQGQQAFLYYLFLSNHQPVQLTEFSINCYNLIKEKKNSDLYALLWINTKTNITRDQLEAAVEGLSLDFGEIVHQKVINKSTIRYEDFVLYKMVFDIESSKERIIFRVDIYADDSGSLYIAAFDGWPVPRRPLSLFSFRYASTGHYYVFILFFLILLIQIVCLVFIIKFKPKRKWLYLVANCFGAPVGVKINWSTLYFVIIFGFNLPAAGFKIPDTLKDAYIIFLFLPIGLIILLDIYLTNKKSKKKYDT